MKSRLISTGNDIVALDQIDVHRTLQMRFYSKILSADEVALFNTGEFQLRFESFVWLCWSIKESVFKFVKRHCHEALFSPTKIVVTSIVTPLQQPEINVEKQESISFRDTECFCCEATCNNQKYYTRSLINSRFIFTVANNSGCFKNIFWGIQTIGKDTYAFQTQQVRAFVLEKLQQQLGSQPLQIEKTAAGFPFIIQHEHIPLSFTHHGNIVGYSFALENIA